jgi:hypothetical protein
MDSITLRCTLLLGANGIILSKVYDLVLKAVGTPLAGGYGLIALAPILGTAFAWAALTLEGTPEPARPPGVRGKPQFWIDASALTTALVLTLPMLTLPLFR